MHYISSNALASICSLKRAPGLIANGVEIQAADIRWRGVNEIYYQRTTRPIGFGGISLPIEFMMSVGATMIGRDLTSPTQGVQFRPTSLAMAKLRRLHAAAGTLAEDTPGDRAARRRRTDLNKR
jgi:hypothetical protein